MPTNELTALMEMRGCCEPSFLTFAADAIDLDGGAFNSIAVFNPEPCCDLTIRTNVGDFYIPACVTAYSPSDLECAAITELEVIPENPSCDLSKVHINLQNTGVPKAPETTGAP